MDQPMCSRRPTPLPPMASVLESSCQSSSTTHSWNSAKTHSKLESIPELCKYDDIAHQNRQISRRYTRSAPPMPSFASNVQITSQSHSPSTRCPQHYQVSTCAGRNAARSRLLSHERSVPMKPVPVAATDLPQGFAKNSAEMLYSLELRTSKMSQLAGEGTDGSRVARRESDEVCVFGLRECCVCALHCFNNEASDEDGCHCKIAGARGCGVRITVPLISSCLTFLANCCGSCCRSWCADYASDDETLSSSRVWWK